MPLKPEGRRPEPAREGWQGWDEYAPFYDWENARTLGRRDVPFWRRVAAAAEGPVLELGCGTGRVTRPLARAGIDIVGIDRSAPMLARAITKSPNHPITKSLRFIRGDIRALPFGARSFSMVLAPYGVLQSLTTPRDLAATLASVAWVVEPGGTFGIDLVPDVPTWHEYANQVQLRGRARGAELTLVESVRQDRKRRLTTFEQRYIERRGGQTRDHCFELVFRTLSVRQMARQLARAGFRVDAILGDYRGRPWDDRADAWIILAKRRVHS
jgi:ubiquinone/menaquinone biosynthesis C-methylase UbiE